VYSVTNDETSENNLHIVALTIVNAFFFAIAIIKNEKEK
jgi:hypothetical protein